MDRDYDISLAKIEVRLMELDAWCLKEGLIDEKGEFTEKARELEKWSDEQEERYGK